jgi:2-haloacid dehalogenase
MSEDQAMGKADPIAVNDVAVCHSDSVVVFDLGGVFLDWDPQHLYRKLIPDVATRDRFLSEVCTPKWHEKQDLGLSIEASCRDLARARPECADLILAWWERNEEMVGGIFDDSVAILSELRSRGIRCYALSNMEREAFGRRRERYAFMSQFDGCVISGVEGVAKPDEQIYRRLITRYQINPQRAAYVDDRKENVDVAVRLGFSGHVFTSAVGLRRWLVELELLD